MNETLTKFRDAVANSADLQEKVKAGADLVALGKESGYEFTQEELESGWEELQESEEGLTDFELEVVSGGSRSLGTYTPSPPGRKLEAVSYTHLTLPTKRIV